MAKNYFVYMLTNHTNTVLYIGITSDLKRRIYEHKEGINISSFSKKYKLYKLIWYEVYSNPEEAILIEKKIKGWKRNKKIELIKSKNPNLKDLLLE